MKRNIRLVIWKNSKGKHKLYFSTDVSMSGTRPNKKINAKLVKELIDIAAYRAA